MTRIHFLIMDEYKDVIAMPHLGIAALAGYLKKKNIDYKISDLRTEYEPHLVSALDILNNPEASSQIFDIPELPLILGIAANYISKRELLYEFDKAISDYTEINHLDSAAVKNTVCSAYDRIKNIIKSIDLHDIVCFSVVTSNYFMSILAALIIKEKLPDIKIVFGGPQITLSRNSIELILKMGVADIAVFGAGEFPLAEIAKRKAELLSPLPGTAIYDSKESRVQYGQRQETPDLSDMDFDFSGFDMSLYTPEIMPVMASRGCVYRCSFCSRNRLFSYELMPVDVIIAHMNYLHEEYGTERFVFADSAINSNRRWLYELCSRLQANKYSFQWQGYFTTELGDEDIDILKNSGLCEANIGIETFSDVLLEKMGKYRRMNKPSKLITGLCKKDIKVKFGIISSFPGETPEDFELTYEAVKELNSNYPDMLQTAVHPFRLMPSTECYDESSSYDISIEGWPEKIRDILPGLSATLEKMHMKFSLKVPDLKETLYRRSQLRSVINSERKISAADIRIMRKILSDRSCVDSSAWLCKEGVKAVEVTKDNKQEYIISYDKLLAVLSKKEFFIVDKMDPANTFLDISLMLAASFNEDRSRAYEQVIALVKKLADNAFPLCLKLHPESIAPVTFI